MKKWIAMMALLFAYLLPMQAYSGDAISQHEAKSSQAAESVTGMLERIGTESGVFHEGDEGVDTARQCCKVCRTGKACGNSCISASKTCSASPGCACNG